MPAELQSRIGIIEDFVLPLAIVTPTATGSPAGADMTAMAGTGVLLKGGRGLGITAKHVARSLQASPHPTFPVAVLTGPEVGDDRHLVRIESFELHPTEDVALFRVADDDYMSRFVVGQVPHVASEPYRLWGYPEDIYHDKASTEPGTTLLDLVFSAGHVRRLVSYEIGAPIPGSQFYELSAPAGGGCSGSAVTISGDIAGDWTIDAVYVGERRNGTNTFAVAYAVRSEVLIAQWPQLADENADLRKLCPLPRSRSWIRRR